MNISYIYTYNFIKFLCILLYIIRYKKIKKSIHDTIHILITMFIFHAILIHQKNIAQYKCSMSCNTLLTCNLL